MRWCKWLAVIAVLVCNASAARPVLIEEFTATWCGWCYGAGLALDRIEAEYPRSQVIVITCHINDDFEITAGSNKFSYYGLSVIPTSIFNGAIREEGFGSTKSQGQAGVTNVYNKFVADIATEASRTATINPFTLTLTGNVGPANPRMTLTVRTSTGYPRPVKARFFITEDDVPVAATNGQTVLNGLARASLGEQTVNLPSAGGQVTLTASYTGTIPYVSAAQLKPVVFLQDDSNKEVMAAIGSFIRTATQNSWTLYQ